MKSAVMWNAWRSLPNPNQWQVTPDTARLLQHWRHDKFGGVRPFFCQVEAAETAIWLTEIAPQFKNGKRLLDHLALANRDANPELLRLALKLATGAGKTTVMAMLIAWQTVNLAAIDAGAHDGPEGANVKEVATHEHPQLDGLVVILRVQRFFLLNLSATRSEMDIAFGDQPCARRGLLSHAGLPSSCSPC